MVCLLAACVSDYRTREVYNLNWWISGAAALLLHWLNGEAAWGRLVELCFFCLLQTGLFSRMYGRADCYAFCVCAAAASSRGLGLREYLMQMAIAFGILAIVQLLRRNLDKTGNLKCPVPFLPYITLSFGLLFLLF